MARSAVMCAMAVSLVSGAAWAECDPASFDAGLPDVSLVPPALPDPGLRPVPPACLANAADPIQQNCTDTEIEAYSTAIAAYSSALQAYVDATTRFANDTVGLANAAAEYAERARDFADGSLDWARCEVEEINAAAN